MNSFHTITSVYTLPVRDLNQHKERLINVDRLKRHEKNMPTLDKNNESKAYLLGGGIGSLAAAAFMIRDGGFSGENIFILD